MNLEQENTFANPSFSEKEIFFNIWTSPRIIFRFINDNKYDKYVNVLLVLAGISRAFDRASMKDMGDSMPLIAIVGISVILGGLLGWVSFYIYAALLSWTGKWLGGLGDTTSLLRALAYAMIPVIIALIFLVPPMSVYGIELFKSEGDITSAGLFPNVIVYGSMIAEFILGIWAIVLSVVAISEVQKISIGMAILNVFLPVLIIVIPLGLLVSIFSVLG